MSAQLKWYVENQVIYFKLPSTIDDTSMIDQMNLQLVELIDQGEEPVHIIMDMTEYKTQFTKLNQLGNMDSMSQLLKHPKIGWSIIITDSSMLKFASSVITNLFKSQFKSCASIEEARAVLKRLDPRLANIEELISQD